jgi:hypothetical protein
VDFNYFVILKLASDGSAQKKEQICRGEVEKEHQVDFFKKALQ